MKSGSDLMQSGSGFLWTDSRKPSTWTLLSTGSRHLELFSSVLRHLICRDFRPRFWQNWRQNFAASSSVFLLLQFYHISSQVQHSKTPFQRRSAASVERRDFFLLKLILVCCPQMDALAHGVAKRRLIRAALKLRMTKTLRPRVAATTTLFCPLSEGLADL